MKVRLKSCYQRVQRNKFGCFHTMNEYMEESGKAAPESIKHDITEHLRQLQNSSEEYFGPNNNDNNWPRNPFIGSFQTEDFSITEYEQLIDIASDSVLKQKFPIISLSIYWVSLTEAYSDISKRALRKLLPLPVTYVNTDFRNRNGDAGLSLQLSPIMSDLKFMCSSKQLHPLH
jgi:hypothetical protein